MSGELDVYGRRVLVLGLGVTGRAVATVLAARGTDVLASDSAGVSDEDAALLTDAGVDVESGGHDRARAGLDEFDFVVPSPGISPLRGFLAEVIECDAKVVSELDLGARLTQAPVLAVTGTNGKTTVCRLAEGVARAAGLNAYACGNLETKFITAADEHPDADLFVVEASSFALTFCEVFKPRVSVITNLAPDHLDWHGTLDHYRAAKARLAAQQDGSDLFLYPAEQPELSDLAPRSGPQRLAFAGEKGDDGPGAWVEGREIVVRLGERIVRAGGAEHLAERGAHFAADAAAAAAATIFLGAGAAAIEEGLGGFAFERHRLEPVGTLRGVRVYDDSVATNVHATLAALRSFDAPIVLIAGGRNKGLDLSPLATQAHRLRCLVTLGEAAGELASVFEGSGVDLRNVGSMPEAVAVALEQARDGDVVLLSPACASHDMYSNYAERGRDFRAACAELGVTS